MKSCKEYVLDDTLAITAIPIEDYSIATYDWQLRPTIGEDDFSPSLQNAITIGLRPSVTDGTVIPIRRTTGKANDDEADGIAGRLHTVKVTCEVDDRDLSADLSGLTVLDYLLTLERTPCHLLLTFRDKTTKGFVSATGDTYLCEVSRDGAKTSLSFRIQNLMGIQLII